MVKWTKDKIEVAEKEVSEAYKNENKPQIKNGPSPYKLNNSINYDTNSDYTNDDYADQSCINNLANNYIISQIYSLFLLPCWSMWKVLFKRRSGNLQVKIHSTIQVKVLVHTRERIYSPNSVRLV